MKWGVAMYIKIKLNKGITICCVMLILLIAFSTLYSGFYPETVTTGVTQGVQLPVIMYHGILADTKLQGDYVISPTQFEEDLKELKNRGYTTVTIGEIVDYVYNGKELPQKPVVLTFDDGYYNNYLYAYPLLKKYACKGVISPIAYYSEQYSKCDEAVSPSYSHCTWLQLKEMQESGCVEIQNHSYNMHSQGERLGIQQQKGESDNVYKQLLIDDISKAQTLIKDNVKHTPIAFTYPFGVMSKISEETIKALGFKCSLICEERTNTITKDKESLYMLGRYLRTDKMTSKEIVDKLEN